MSIRMKTTPFFILPLIFPVASDASWYVGTNAGIANTDVSSSDLNARLKNEGLSGTAAIDKSRRFGWRFFGGYQWGKYVAVEGGYTNLGAIDVSYSGSSVLTAKNLQAIYPPSASGYELSLLGRYPFNETVSGFIQGGAFSWQSTYNVGSGDVNYRGTDPFVGLGGEWRFAERWSLRLAWDRYTVAKDATDLFSLGISYHFAERSPVEHTAEQTATPLPATVLAAAPTHPAPVEAVAEQPSANEPPESKPTPAMPPVPEPALLAPQTWALRYNFAAVEPIEAERELAAAQEDLSAHPHAVVHITGYADTTGPEAYNLTLSRKRAEMLAEKLAKRGVAVDRITTEGKGSADPVADNGTRAGRASNRRAVILVHEPDSSSPRAKTDPRH